jgi:hypothetical protein
MRTATSPSSDGLKPTVTLAPVFRLPSTFVSPVIRKVRFSAGLPMTARLTTIRPGGRSAIVPETISVSTEPAGGGSWGCPAGATQASSRHTKTVRIGHTSRLCNRDEADLKKPLEAVKFHSFARVRVPISDDTRSATSLRRLPPDHLPATLPSHTLTQPRLRMETL